MQPYVNKIDYVLVLGGEIKERVEIQTYARNLFTPKTSYYNDAEIVFLKSYSKFIVKRFGL